MIVGVGGQGTLLTSRILGNAILNSGLDVKLSEVHGMAQRGGSVTTFVRYGTKVYEPIVEEGQADVLIAFERLEALRYSHFLKEDGILIVNDQRIDPISVIAGGKDYPQDVFETLEKRHRNIIRINALDEALRIGNVKVFNVVILGALSQFLEIDRNTWEETIRQTVPKKTIEVNLKAFEVGRIIGEKYDKTDIRIS